METTTATEGLTMTTEPFTLFELVNLPCNTQRAYGWDVRTRRGAFAGVITFSAGVGRVYFNGNCTRGSARKFSSVNEALEYIVARRQKKGWRF